MVKVLTSKRMLQHIQRYNKRDVLQTRFCKKIYFN